MKVFRKSNGWMYVRFTGMSGASVEMSLKTRREFEAQDKAKKFEAIEQAAKARLLAVDGVNRALTGGVERIDDAALSWGYEIEGMISERTANNYRCFVNKFIRDTGLNGKPLSAASRAIVSGWVNNPAAGRKAGSRQVMLAALKHFFTYCQSTGLVTGDPTRMVKVDRGILTHRQNEPSSRSPFTEAEIEHILQATEGFWRAAVIIGLETGLRLGDVARIEWACFETEPGHVVVWTDKRDQRVCLPVSLRLRELLAELPKEDERYLFPVQAEKARVNAAVLSQEFAKVVINPLGMNGKSFHCLRHTFAHRWKDMGKTVDEIRMALGHAHEATTLVYTES